MIQKQTEPKEVDDVPTSYEEVEKKKVILRYGFLKCTKQKALLIFRLLHIVFSCPTTKKRKKRKKLKSKQLQRPQQVLRPAPLCPP
jgi:hypothetical protein